MAGLTLDKVHSVEMLGGGVRMPRVKKILDEYFKASKLELGEIGQQAMNEDCIYPCSYTPCSYTSLHFNF